MVGRERLTPSTLKIRGSNSKMVTLADGRIATYYYAWKDDPRLHGEQVMAKRPTMRRAGVMAPASALAHGGGIRAAGYTRASEGDIDACRISDPDTGGWMQRCY